MRGLHTKLNSRAIREILHSVLGGSLRGVLREAIKATDRGGVHKVGFLARDEGGKEGSHAIQHAVKVNLKAAIPGLFKSLDIVVGTVNQRSVSDETRMVEQDIASPKVLTRSGSSISQLGFSLTRARSQL